MVSFFTSVHKTDMFWCSFETKLLSTKCSGVLYGAEKVHSYKYEMLPNTTDMIEDE